MIKKLISLILIGLCVVSINVNAQEKEYKIYNDNKNGFSFEIPANWIISRDTEDKNSFQCKPSIKKEIDLYKDCYEGIIFRISIYKSNLEKLLLEDAMYKKINGIYYTSDRISDSIKTENIKGTNWQGIYHNNVCGITCKETGFHALDGRCEYFYFSNNKKTICLETNGRELNTIQRAKILQTFKFD